MINSLRNLIFDLVFQVMKGSGIKFLLVFSSLVELSSVGDSRKLTSKRCVE